MDNILGWLITYFLIYGIPVLGVAIVVGSNAIPSGAIILAIAAGALAYSGDFIFWQLLLWVWFFNVIGDVSSYWIWRAFGTTIKERFLATRHYLALTLRQASTYLEKYGLASIFFTRFPLAGLGPPMNILSGLSGYNLPRFMLAIIPGDLIYSAFTLGIGYWFGDAWQTASNTVNQYSHWITTVSALAIVMWLLFNQVRKHYFPLKSRRRAKTNSPDQTASRISG
jgi:membrane-associated protein